MGSLGVELYGKPGDGTIREAWGWGYKGSLGVELYGKPGDEYVLVLL